MVPILTRDSLFWHAVHALSINVRFDFPRGRSGDRWERCGAPIWPVLRFATGNDDADIADCVSTVEELLCA